MIRIPERALQKCTGEAAGSRSRRRPLEPRTEYRRDERQDSLSSATASLSAATTSAASISQRQHYQQRRRQQQQPQQQQRRFRNDGRRTSPGSTNSSSNSRSRSCGSNDGSNSRASHLKFERVEKREYCWRRHSQGESALTRSLLDSAVLTPNYISVLLPPCQSSDSRKVERQRVVRLEVPLMQPFTVQHAIEKLVTTYGIKGRVSDFDLRCVDVASCFGSDGDGDGNEGGDWAGMRLEPDLDLPPLELATDVRKFDVDVLALCSHATAAAAASLMCGGQSEFGAASRLLKVRMPGGDCHVLSLDDADIYLSDVLRRLSKKRLKALDPEEFTFHYPRNGARSAPPLDLGMRIDDLDVLSLHLRRLDAEMVVLPSSLSPGGRDGRCEPANFVFSDESASVYKEWIVYKKNRWGRKQQRRLGIDRSTIYNNSDTRQVKRVARSISDLIDVKLVAGRPKCFEMLFRNQAEVITVSYQALNEFDCAEIVARLNYIRRM